MQIEVSRIALLIVATIMTLIWSFLAIKYEHEFDDYLENIDPEEKKFVELFSIGLGLMTIFHFDRNGKKARERIQKIGEVKGKQYADFYYIIFNGEKWSYGITIFTISSLIAALANYPLALFFGGLIAVLMMYDIDVKFDEKLEERRNALISDMPQMLSTLALLLNANVTLLDAWEQLASHNDHVLYREMKQTMTDIDNGIDERVAFMAFADRCSIKEIKRFVSNLLQSNKIGSDISSNLKSLSDEMWQEKKNIIQKKAQAANSKLMIPMFLIFIGILLMIIVPSMQGL